MNPRKPASLFLAVLLCLSAAGPAFAKKKSKKKKEPVAEQKSKYRSNKLAEGDRTYRFDSDGNAILPESAKTSSEKGKAFKAPKLVLPPKKKEGAPPVPCAEGEQCPPAPPAQPQTP